jgi:serine/threonine-protein kinase
MTPFGRYQLVEPLGEGGMAQVWRARLEASDGFARDLVIKRILDDRRRDPTFASMFAREARLLAMLRHSNIIQVFDYGDVDGEPYLAMEFVEGVDVRRLVAWSRKQGERLAPGVCAFIAREVARALKHMHDAVDEAGRPMGLVHRDISPSNVLVGVDGSVKVLDFGVAKAAHDRSLTATGGFRGKVSYAAPEVLEGQAHEARSDLFALGVVMHEMLVGRRLFDAPSDLQTLGLVRAAAVRAPSELAPGVPASLDAICLRALARLPGDRFESAQALLTAIDPIVHELQTGPEQLAALVAKVRSSPATPGSAVKLPPAQATPKAGSRRGLVAAGALAVVAVLGIGGFKLVNREPVPTPAAIAAPVAAPAPAPPPSPAPAPPPEAVAAPPAAVALQHLELKSNPPGATVKTRAGRVLGETPFKAEWPVGERPTALLLERPGFLPATVQLSDKTDAVEVVTLKRRAHRKPGGANVPNLEDGNVVDPFPPHH